ncbi:MAG: DUF1801 domain-containing protein [Elusimicrobia bacterium]|nr:DUF1801 domain-containing protein [Elusimicrobiota bacterium]
MAAKGSEVDRYIAGFPIGVRRTLKNIRALVQAVAPQSEEVLRYGIPTYRIDGKNLIHFGAWKRSISLYPAPRGDAALRRAIKPYLNAKSTLRFPLEEPVPYELIAEVLANLIAEKAGKTVTLRKRAKHR